MSRGPKIGLCLNLDHLPSLLLLLCAEKSLLKLPRTRHSPLISVRLWTSGAHLCLNGKPAELACPPPSDPQTEAPGDWRWGELGEECEGRVARGRACPPWTSAVCLAAPGRQLCQANLASLTQPLDVTCSLIPENICCGWVTSTLTRKTCP